MTQTNEERDALKGVLNGLQDILEELRALREEVKKGREVKTSKVINRGTVGNLKEEEGGIPVDTVQCVCGNVYKTSSWYPEPCPLCRRRHYREM